MVDYKDLLERLTLWPDAIREQGHSIGTLAQDVEQGAQLLATTLEALDREREAHQATRDEAINACNMAAEFEARADKAEAEIADANREVLSLIESIWRAEYSKDAPDWQPLPDLVGRITQLDNMYAGVRSQRDKAEAERDALVKVVDWYADQMCEYGKDNPGCGHFHTDICAGCKARASLARHGLAVKEVG